MKITPIKKFCGEFTVPADKSITHRGVLLAGIANGESVIKNALLGEDCLSSIGCMRALGAQVDVEGSTVCVRGTSSFRDGCTLDAGNSGTTTRLLAGLVAGYPISSTFVGDPSLSKRPMKRIISPLTKMGARFEAPGDHLPMTVHGGGLHAITFDNVKKSAQVKSAVLLAGLNAEGTTVVREEVKSRDHTEIMLQQMGADLVVNGDEISVRKSKLNPIVLNVPGDISSAAYLIALGCIAKDAHVILKNVGVNPTRTGILDVLAKMGANVRLHNVSCAGEPVCDVEIESSSLENVEIGGALIPRLIDELPVLACIGAFAKGKMVIKDAQDLRTKESDRIDAVVSNLRAMGVSCEGTEDGMCIEGMNGCVPGGGVIDPRMDHRIAMSFAVLAAASQKGAEILQPECVNISYPGFYDIFNR